jgi:tetratricopeptide (TPR) repeat protein
MLDKFLASLNDRQKGELFQQINDWPRATTYYQSYLRKSQDSLSLADQAQIQNLIGIGYIKQSKGDSAMLFLHTALQAYEKVNDQEMVGTVYNNLGSAHKSRKAWPEAIEWLRKSAAHNRAMAGDSASVLGFTYYHLAEVFLHTHQPDSARYYVEKSLLLRQALGEAENVKQSRELWDRILSAVPSSVKK